MKYYIKVSRQIIKKYIVSLNLSVTSIKQLEIRILYQISTENGNLSISIKFRENNYMNTTSK